jgi:hypothetical protein
MCFGRTATIVARKLSSELWALAASFEKLLRHSWHADLFPVFGAANFQGETSEPQISPVHRSPCLLKGQLYWLVEIDGRQSGNW